MSSFIRKISDRWHNEVPGARWFRADLHVHTLDDHPSSNFRFPDGVNGTAADPITQNAYARLFLQAAIANKIEVIGLTPHAVLSGNADETSAIWRIVDIWNTEQDNDGIPSAIKYTLFSRDLSQT